MTSTTSLSQSEDGILTRSEFHLVPVVMDDFKILNKSNNFYVLNANTADNVCDMKYLDISRSDYTCLVLSALAFRGISHLRALENWNMTALLIQREKSRNINVFLCISISPSESRQGLAFPSRVFLVAAPLKPISIFCPHLATHLLPSPGERNFILRDPWLVGRRIIYAKSLIMGGMENGTKSYRCCKQRISFETFCWKSCRRPKGKVQICSLMASSCM